jgi:HSP20 family protein
MALVKFSNNYPSLFDPFFDDEWLSWVDREFADTNTTLPSVNIKEAKEQFEIEVAAPGFDKSDFKVETDGNVLTISSEKKMENETKDDQRFTRKEFSYQSFSRSFVLPDSVETDKIAATYEKGILKLTLPKKEEAKTKPAKSIEIK